MTRPRLAWKISLALSVAAAVVLAVGALAIHRRNAALARRLVSDANAVAAEPHPRPVHVSRALPGAVGDGLARHLPAVERVWDALAADAETIDAIREILAGARPPGETPPRVVEALVAVGPALDGVLHATRAERAELPYGIDGFQPVPDATWLGVQGAASLAGVRARRSLAAGNVEDAVSDCLDGLALGRDASIAGGLVGNMIATAIASKLQDVCAAGLDSLPEAERRAKIAKVRGLRDALIPFDQLMRREAVDIQLMFWGCNLPAEARSRLAEIPRRQAASADCAPSFRERLVRVVLWGPCRTLQDAIIEAAARPIPERDRALEDLAESTQRGLLSDQLPNPRKFLVYARRIDGARLRLDLLVAAAGALDYRASRGQWPGEIGALVRAGLLEPSEGERLRRLQLSDPRAPEQLLGVPLPLADERPAEVRVSATRHRAGDRYGLEEHSERERETEE